MQVVIIGPNLIDQSKGSFHVHAANCLARHRPEYRPHSDDANTPYEMTSQIEVSEFVFGDMIDEGSMSAKDGLSDLHFSKCTTALK